MATEVKAIHLTDRQISHAVVALQEYIKLLNKEAAEDPQGGEHEDILIADSIIRELAQAKKAPGVPP